MMAYSEDHIALAAEYALGTLDADERARVEAMMSIDQEFTAMVEGWERKLGVLNQMVGSVEPRDEVWEKIKASVGITGIREVDVVAVANDGHEQSAAPHTIAPQTVTPVYADTAEMSAMIADNSNVIELSRRARRWRGIATAMTAIAAVMVAMVSVQVYRPELLPDGLRPKAPAQVAQVQPPASSPTAAPAQYVALLQSDSTSPAFILTVDAGTKNFTVRKVGASPEPGKSFELWIVSDKLQRPRSLGVVGSADFTTRSALASYDPDTVNKATYAVTVEPEGGSPTGAATGPIVFTGKLIETVPASTAR